MKKKSFMATVLAAGLVFGSIFNSFDDYVAKVANSLMDYYKQTGKWNFSYKADYVFSSEAEITNFNQKLYEALAVQIRDTYTYAGYTAVDNGYVISNAFVELREY